MSRTVKLRNRLSPTTAEGQWVKFQHDEGLSVDQIVENVNRLIGGYGPGGSDTQLVVEYQLEERPFSDVQHLLHPHEPTGISFLCKTEDGYLCRTHGGPEARFDVLIKAPSISEDELKRILVSHTNEIAWIAYKNAHEGYPFGYSLLGDPPLTNRAAKAGISYVELRHLL